MPDEAEHAPEKATVAVRRKASLIKGTLIATIAYVVALIYSFATLVGFPPEARMLSGAAAAMVLKHRGVEVDSRAKYPAFNCMAEPVCQKASNGQFSYAQVVDAIRLVFIADRHGNRICNAWLLEPIWRTPCLEFELGVQSGLSAEEIGIVFDVISHPCRYRDQVHVDINRTFRCLGDRAMLTPRVLIVFFSLKVSPVNATKLYFDIN